MLRKNYLFLVPGIMLLCFLSACGATSVTGSSATPIPKPAKDLVQSSITAMNGLKTDHIVSNVTTQTSLANTSGGATIKLTGDEVLPGQGSYTFTENATAGSVATDLNFAELITNNKLYIQNKLGKWYVLDSSATGIQSILYASKDTGASSILKLTQNATFTDHGEETLNGRKLRHITATLSKNALNDKIKANLNNLSGASGGANTSQEINSFFNAMQLSNSSLDLWIDNATSYLYRSTLKYTMHFNLSAMSGTPTATTPTPAASTSATEMDSTSTSTSDYSAFNKSVTLKIPADAIPATNIIDTIK